MKKYYKPEIELIALHDVSVLNVSTGVDEGMDYIGDNYGW